MSNKLYNVAKKVAKVASRGPLLVAGSVAINATTQYYAQKKRSIQKGSQVSNKKTKARIAKNKQMSVEKKRHAKRKVKK